VMQHASGQYVELKGWKEDLRECREMSELPTAAREYLDFMAEFVDVPLALVSVGPGAADVIWAQGSPGPVRPSGQAVTDVPVPATEPIRVQASRR